MLDLLLGATFGYGLGLLSEEWTRQDAESLGRESFRRCTIDTSLTPDERLERLSTQAVLVLRERHPELCRKNATLLAVVSDPIFIRSTLDAVLSLPESPRGKEAREDIIRRFGGVQKEGPQFGSGSDLAARFLSLLDSLVTADDRLFRHRNENTGAHILLSLAGIEIGMEEVLDNARMLPEIKDLIRQLADRKDNLELIAATPPARSLPQPNSYFVGRKELLSSVCGRFAAAQPRRVAITGPGGIGKTQAAVEIADRCQNLDIAVFWIRASNREHLTADLLSVAHILGSSFSPNSTIASITREIERLTERGCSYLLVFDGVDELDIILGAVPKNCHALLTTRNARPSIPNFVLEVEELRSFSEAEAESFFSCRFPNISLFSSEYVVRRELISLLGGYPLALEQAAAYMETRRIGFDDYIRRFKALKTDIFAHQSAVHGRLPAELDGHDASILTVDEWLNVATTWSLNFRQLRADNFLASRLLEGIAFLATEDLPFEVVLELFQRLGMNDNAFASKETLLHELDLALADISKYSLASVSDSKAVTQHEILSLALRQGLEQEDAEAVCEVVLVAFEAALPYAQRVDWRHFNRFIPHATSLLSRPELAKSSRTDLGAEILARIGSYFLEMERYEAAIRILTSSMEIMTKVSPPMIERLISNLSNLGNAFRGSGAFEEAKGAFEMALDLLNKVQPTEGLAHAIMYNQIGTLQSRLGNPNTALVFAEKAVALSRAGGSDEHVAIHAHNLAKLYEHYGRIDEAETLYRESLELLELTEASPAMIANVVSSLAHVYAARGDFNKSFELESDALRRHEQYWPPQHPAIARRVNDYANALFSLGRIDEAIEAAKRSLAIRQLSLGIANPEYAQAKMNYGAMLVHAGRPNEASSHLEQALETFKLVFGVGHPETGEAHNALGHALCELGKTDQGVKHYELALEIFQNRYPEGHRTSATILHNMGGAYHRLGKHQKGLDAFRRSLEISKRLMPDNHPHLCATFHNRAHMLLDLGRLAEAEADLVVSLEIAKSSKQSDMVSPLIRFAHLRFLQNRRDEANGLLVEAQAIAAECFPSTHRAFSEIRWVLDQFTKMRTQSQVRSPRKRRRKPNVRYLPKRDI